MPHLSNAHARVWSASPTTHRLAKLCPTVRCRGVRARVRTGEVGVCAGGGGWVGVSALSSGDGGLGSQACLRLGGRCTGALTCTTARVSNGHAGCSCSLHAIAPRGVTEARHPTPVVGGVCQAQGRPDSWAVTPPPPPPRRNMVVPNCRGQPVEKSRSLQNKISTARKVGPGVINGRSVWPHDDVLPSVYRRLP